MKRLLTILLLFMLGTGYASAKQYVFSGTVTDSLEPGKVLDGMVIGKNSGIQAQIEKNVFRIEGLDPGVYEFVFEVWGYEPVVKKITVKDRDITFNLLISARVEELNTVRVTAKSTFESYKLPDVKGVALFASKKTEVVIPTPMTTNLATNLPRQLFKSIPGLNIWESDAGGLQLGIGARGLNPNRTSNFNTRQNGYDISADALGYPESYYTPPAEAIKQIEVVRGAASLQYGPQFGGMLNFVMDDGPDHVPVHLKGSLTYGSYNFLQSYNHLTVNQGDWKINTSFQFKNGSGFRPNSGFRQTMFFTSARRKIGDRFVVQFDLTRMDYLAQQPGGLMDYQFEQDPLQSLRSRNWFMVEWNLAALNFDYRISSRLRYNARLWVLHAKRNSAGELGKISRPDPMRERDLIKGKYENTGMENRFLYRYKVQNVRSVLSFGTRTYLGFTQNRQGYTDDGSDARFTYLDPDTPGISDYIFPGVNHALFAENMIHINNNWSITPGVRVEYIRTAAKGYYINRVYSGDEIIFEKQYPVHKVRKRAFPLFGIGSSYRIDPKLELYANASENYRSISFTDLTVSNPNLLIDSNLRDESGFNVDLGIRGVIGHNRLRFDFSLFYLRYDNRIGIVEKEHEINGVSSLASYRTNIGQAETRGLEGYAEWNLLASGHGTDSFCRNLTVFVNGSVMEGHYTEGAREYNGNTLEFVPTVNLKAGFMMCLRGAFVSYQVSYTAEQYTDATNAEFVTDATRGIIPAYWVHDLNLGYEWGRFTLKASINNLLDNSYFTRRALSYPGPGIIPAEPRTVYLTLIYNIQKK